MELDEVVVPADNLLGKENQGFEIIMSSSFPNSKVLKTKVTRIQHSHTNASGSVLLPFD